MNRITLFAAAALVAGCATSPQPSPTASVVTIDCGQLAADIARTQDELRTAQAKKEDAWKAIVPFAVVGRAISAGQAVDSAEQRLADLRSRAERQGCTA